jgi:hypothetical protein
MDDTTSADNESLLETFQEAQIWPGVYTYRKGERTGALASQPEPQEQPGVSRPE